MSDRTPTIAERDEMVRRLETWSDQPLVALLIEEAESDYADRMGWDGDWSDPAAVLAIYGQVVDEADARGAWS